jgi:hypothetical protein
VDGSPRPATRTCAPGWSSRPGPTSTPQPGHHPAPASAADQPGHHRPVLDRSATPVCPVPAAGRPQDQPQRGHRGHRPGAGRVPVGRNDRHRLTADQTTIMNSRADTRVGTRTARANRTTRRGTPWQDRSPFDLCPSPGLRPGMAAPSQGPPPAHPRHAIPTRVHQTGGAPTRTSCQPHPAHRLHGKTLPRHSLPRRSIIRCRQTASRTPPASLRDRRRRSLTRSVTRGSQQRSRQGAD